jgi:transposase
MQYHTGCDAHKRSCTLHHLDADGTHGLHMKVETDKQSIYQFLEQLDAPTTMTLEAGCNWWFLYHLFQDHPSISEVNVVDPRRSKKIAGELSVLSGYGRASNDHIDSEMLAELRRRELAPAIRIPSPRQMEIRTVNRFRLDTVFNATRAKNKIHALLAMHGASVKINDLLNASDTFMRIKERLPEYVRFIIDLLIKRVIHLTQQIELCESKLDTLLPKSDPKMKIVTSHPGIGVIFGRIILTEVLDITYFKEPKYLISYAGLAPVESESAGRKKGKIGLNRHCNYYLKYAFVSAANNSRNHPKYRKKYELDVKKHGKMIAKLNLARRIIKTIYWMLIRQQYYRQ